MRKVLISVALKWGEIQYYEFYLWKIPCKMFCFGFLGWNTVAGHVFADLSLEINHGQQNLIMQRVPCPVYLEW